MQRSELQELIDYTVWANTRLLDAAATLADADLRRDLKSSFPSVLETLLHIMAAEWVWLSRWQGSSPTAMPVVWRSLDLAGLRATWVEIERARAAFLSALADGALDQPVSYRNFAGVAYAAPLSALVRHVVNHSSYHRGQVTTLLRQLGASAPATDLVEFQREQQQLSA